MQFQNYDQLRVISQQLLTNDESINIIKLFDNFNNYEHKIQSTFRNVMITDINILSIPNLKNAIISANEYFKFNINVNNSDCFFAKYDTGMHYQQLHMDCIAGENQRKLSFSLTLNNDFKGGEFQLLHNETVETKMGKLLVFPSFLPHCVSPVISGSRFVIFGWFYGPNFI